MNDKNDTKWLKNGNFSVFFNISINELYRFHRFIYQIISFLLFQISFIVLFLLNGDKKIQCPFTTIQTIYWLPQEFERVQLSTPTQNSWCGEHFWGALQKQLGKKITEYMTKILIFYKYFLLGSWWFKDRKNFKK